MKYWNGLSYQKRVRWLAIVSLLSLLLCYKLAAVPTLLAYKSFKKNSASGLPATTRGEKAALLARSKRLEQIWQLYLLDTLNQEKNLLPIVTELCQDNHLQLKDFRPIGIGMEDSVKILTRSITVEGDFSNCLQLVYALEVFHMAGRLSAVQYKSVTEGKEKNIRLLCFIQIQNIIP